MKTFKHSGTLGDILYSLPVVKYLGGGEFYLHLNQVAWIAQYYYNSKPSEYHTDKMNSKDIDFMHDFMTCQTYIKKFAALDPNQEITHNLDRFRPTFVHHPTNYIRIYCESFNITDIDTQNQIINQPWFTVPNPRPIPGHGIIINRTSRGWTSSEHNPQWDLWREQKWDQRAIFVGLPEEYQEFCTWSHWRLNYIETKNLLEVAEIIAGAELFIGNQSMALSLAQGLHIPYIYERRKDLDLARNESYFPTHTQGSNF